MSRYFDLKTVIEIYKSSKDKSWKRLLYYFPLTSILSRKGRGGENA